jgi:hypothetical protein
MTSTICFRATRPWSRRPCRAGKPEMAATAACSKVRFIGLGASLSSRADTYSANEALPMPNTSSPGWNLDAGPQHGEDSPPTPGGESLLLLAVLGVA